MQNFIYNTSLGEGGRAFPQLPRSRRFGFSRGKEVSLPPEPPTLIGNRAFGKSGVFRNRDGGALLPSCINRAIKRIVRDYNRDKTADMVTLPEFSVHQLRHTFCTRLCENSSNVKAIQEIMGHADITTTMNVYADATRQAKKNTLEAMEGKVKIS